MSSLSTIAAAAIDRDWATSQRWLGVERQHEADDVIRLRGSIRVEHSLARRGAERLWYLLHGEGSLSARAAASAGQAVAAVRAGANVIYLPGAAVGQPTEALVASVNSALRRADQIEWAAAVASGQHEVQREWLAPVIAAAQAAFGGAAHVYELTHALIEAGAAGMLLDDRLSEARGLGHGGGGVLIPTAQHVRMLDTARLAADVAGVPTLICARTGTLGAELLTSDVDARDRDFLADERSPEGYHRVCAGIEPAVARGLAYAPHADLLWFETPLPDPETARIFAGRIHDEYPETLLAYSCSSLSDRYGQRDSAARAVLDRELAASGYTLCCLGVTTGLNTSAPAETDASAGRDEPELLEAYFNDVASTLPGGMVAAV